MLHCPAVAALKSSCPLDLGSHCQIVNPPQGVVEATALKARSPNSYTSLHSKHYFDVAPFPLNPEESETIGSFPETFVLTLSRGRVLGTKGVVITADNEVLKDTALEWRSIEKHSVFSLSFMPPLVSLSGRVAVLASNGFWCYYHWLFEIIPRFILLRDSKLSFDGLILPPIDFAFQMETLEHFGWSHYRLIQMQSAYDKGSNFLHPDSLNERDYLEVETLLVPSLPARSCTIPIWVCEALRKEFLPSTLEEPLLSLFISRRNALARRIVNEDDLFTYLQSQGFQRVYLEDYSMKEQAALLSKAKRVVSPHGAGLSNLVFCQPGTKVVELFGSLLDGTYCFLSQQVKLDYHCLQGIIHHRSGKDSDLEIPLDQVQALVEG